jgi:hypothetical protein
MKVRNSSRWALAASGLVSLCLPAVFSAAPPDGILPPPLPPQPGLASPSCTSKPPGASPWTTVLDSHFAIDDNAAAAPMTVDPTVPCRLYRVSDDATVQRSTDSGATWRTVFHDEAKVAGADVPPALPGPLPSISPVLSPKVRAFAALRSTVSTTGAVYLAEQGNGDGVVASDDAGRTWRLSDNGLLQQRVQRITVAPSDASVMYVEVAGAIAQGRSTAAGSTVTPPLVTGLYVSYDSGATWAAASTAGEVGALAGGGVDAHSIDPGADTGGPILAVDPSNSGHLWMLGASQGELTTVDSRVGAVCDNSWNLLESTDHGATWTDDGAVPLGPGLDGGCPDPNQLVVTRRSNGRLRLLTTADVPPYVFLSDDDGADWKGVDLGRGNLAEVTALADPAAPSRVTVVGLVQQGDLIVTSAQLVAFTSADGFSTWTQLPVVSLNWNYGYPAGLLFCRQSASGCQYARGGLSVNSISGAESTQRYQDALGVDHDGRFYVSVIDGCADAACSPPKPFTTPAFNRVRLLRIEAAGSHLQPPACGPAAGCVSGHVADTTKPASSSGNTMPTVLTCPLRSLSSPTAGTFGAGGSLSFDGQDLLYIDDGYPQQLSDGSMVGVIHKLRPYPACSDDGDIQVSFDPHQFKSNPVFGQVAYDVNRNVMWVAVNDYTDQLRMEVLEVTVTRAVSGPLSVSSAVGVLRWKGVRNGGTANCGWAYDWTTDTILSCQTSQGVSTDRVRPMDGTPVPSCLDAYRADTSPGQNGWTVGAPGSLYIEQETDTTMLALETTTCHVYETYVHRFMGETTQEDDQLACDGVSLGEGSGYPAPTSVIWERDEAANIVSAFAVPDAYCPYPTVTTYLGPSSAERGSAGALCAALQTRGRNLPLHNQPLDFRLDGVEVGIQQTGSTGVACVPTFFDLPAGRHTVEASFAGNHAYMPSEDVGTLTIWEPGQAVVAAPTINLPPPPPPPAPAGGAPPPPPSTVNAPAPATVESIAPAVQAQPQPQPVSQAMGQPVAVGARQHQVQPQLSLSLAPEVNSDRMAESYAMTALTSAQPSGSPAAVVAAGGVAGIVATGLGVAMRLARRTELVRARGRRR